MTLFSGCAAPGSDAPPAHTLSAPQALRAAATALLAPPSFGDAPSGNTDAPGASPADLLPGLYALDRLAIDVTGTTVILRAQRPCSDVLDELQAGQWTARIIPAMDNPLSSTMAVLSYGDRMAMAYLKGGRSGKRLHTVHRHVCRQRHHRRDLVQPAGGHAHHRPARRL